MHRKFLDGWKKGASIGGYTENVRPFSGKNDEACKHYIDESVSRCALVTL